MIDIIVWVLAAITVVLAAGILWSTSSTSRGWDFYECVVALGLFCVCLPVVLWIRAIEQSGK